MPGILEALDRIDKRAALAKQFGAPFDRTQQQTKLAVRCSLRSHKPHRDSGFFFRRAQQKIRAVSRMGKNPA